MLKYPLVDQLRDLKLNEMASCYRGTDEYERHLETLF
jgi:hypothetical protein